MGPRIVGSLAVLGGVGLTVACVVSTFALLDHPGVPPWKAERESAVAVIGIASILCVGLSLAGLGFVVLDRFESPVALVAIVGGLVAGVAVLGAPQALYFVPIASTVVFVYLAWRHAIHWVVAGIHAAAAPGFLIAVSAYDNASLALQITPWVLAWCISWIAIGAQLIRLPLQVAP